MRHLACLFLLLIATAHAKKWQPIDWCQSEQLRLLGINGTNATLTCGSNGVLLVNGAPIEGGTTPDPGTGGGGTPLALATNSLGTLSLVAGTNVLAITSADVTGVTDGRYVTPVSLNATLANYLTATIDRNVYLQPHPLAPGWTYGIGAIDSVSGSNILTEYHGDLKWLRKFGATNQTSSIILDYGNIASWSGFIGTGALKIGLNVPALGNGNSPLQVVCSDFAVSNGEIQFLAIQSGSTNGVFSSGWDTSDTNNLSYILGARKSYSGGWQTGDALALFVNGQYGGCLTYGNRVTPLGSHTFINTGTNANFMVFTAGGNIVATLASNGWLTATGFIGDGSLLTGLPVVSNFVFNPPLAPVYDNMLGYWNVGVDSSVMQTGQWANLTGRTNTNLVDNARYAQRWYYPTGPEFDAPGTYGNYGDVLASGGDGATYWRPFITEGPLAVTTTPSSIKFTSTGQPASGVLSNLTLGTAFILVTNASPYLAQIGNNIYFGTGTIGGGVSSITIGTSNYTGAVTLGTISLKSSNDNVVVGSLNTTGTVTAGSAIVNGYPAPTMLYSNRYTGASSITLSNIAPASGVFRLAVVLTSGAGAANLGLYVNGEPGVSIGPSTYDSSGVVNTGEKATPAVIGAAGTNGVYVLTTLSIAAYPSAQKRALAHSGGWNNNPYTTGANGQKVGTVSWTNTTPLTTLMFTNLSGGTLTGDVMLWQ